MIAALIEARESPRPRLGIGAMASTIANGEMVMTIGEYVGATALIALIVWGVLGLLMQET